MDCQFCLDQFYPSSDRHNCNPWNLFGISVAETSIELHDTGYGTRAEGIHRCVSRADEKLIAAARTVVVHRSMAALDRRLDASPSQKRIRLPPDPSSTKRQLEEEFAPAKVRLAIVPCRST